MTSGLKPKLIPRDKNWAGQFVLGVSDGPTLPGATAYRLNGVVLQVFPGLRVTSALDRDGNKVGWVLGDLVDHDAKVLVTHQITILFDQDANIDSTIEKTIYRFSGRFIFILALEHRKRVYIDACGTLSLVYDPVERRAASSTGLLLNDEAYIERFDRELYDFLDVPGEGWFPGGLTAHTGINRLMCNHYLDLTDWRPIRHWPVQRICETSDPLGNVSQICTIVRDAIAILRQDGPIAMALTAGNDTRLLLACCRGSTNNIDFVTVDGQVHLDVVRARELSQRFHLQHILLPLVLASEEQALQFQYQAGHCIGGSNVESHPSIEPLSRFRYFIGGVGGEIGRAFFWRATDGVDTKVTPKSIVFRMGMPVHPRILRVVELWFDGIEHLDPLLQLDLAFLELRVSCWAFAQAYSHPIVPQISPLISRDCVRLMLELPPIWKRRRMLITEGIRALWPELLSMPINRYGDIRDILFLVIRVIRNPHLIAKKIRKKFGGP